MTDLALEIDGLRRLSPSLLWLRLRATDGGRLPAASAGAHIVLLLPGTAPMRRSYSLVSPPGARGGWEIVVRHATNSRGGSAWLHQHAHPGLRLQAHAPINLFPLSGTARRHLMIAGGVGMTPFLSYLPTLRAAGHDYALHGCLRGEDHAAFADWLSGDPRVRLYLDAARRRLDLGALLRRQPLGTQLYLCGPESLMRAAAEAAAAAGWPHTHVQREAFGGATGGRPFVVRLARSGRQFVVGAEQSLLEALEAAGVAAPSLCRGGACGVCLTTVLDGQPEHRDLFLSPAERASGHCIMPCVSRAQGDSLDLDL